MYDVIKRREHFDLAKIANTFLKILYLLSKKNRTTSKGQ